MKILAIFLSCSCVLLSIFPTGGAADTIAVNQTVRDGDTIVSGDESFELGFFSPGDSNNRYVGIWYKKVANGTVVWVANRETPVNDSSGVLKLTDRGTLQILAGNETVVWSSNSSVSAGNPTAQILDTGNLVVRDETRVSIWESFDHPGDTFLPGMKIGKDLSRGKDRFLTSWASNNDPSEGEYLIRVDTDGFPQLFERRRSVTSVPQSRFGPWNGVTFNGMPNLGEDSILTHRFVIDSDEVYYEYDLMNSSLVSRMIVNPDGNIVRLNWIDRNRGWVLYSTATIDACSRYGICGPFGKCNINNAPACSCMDGFEPRQPEEWNVADWSSGCRRKESIDCGNGDGFRRVSGVKFPDTSRSWYNVTATLAECEAACRRNCSCTAYAGLDIRRGGSGCLLWFDDLVDIRVYDESQQLYVRMAASELTGVPASESGSHTKKKTMAVAVSTSLGGLVAVGLLLALYVAWTKRKRSRAARLRDPASGVHENYTRERHKEDTDLSSFSLSTIANATHDFAIGNKLGEGGFGPVYKGVLEGGQEVAVKRLSKTSIQGLDQFKNEVLFIARLQHRNLVRLLGYCTQGDERMLIYEYMPNKSLNSFIFDKPEGSMLDWPQRFRVIHGIARGLLYLHQDSRLRIIHRDLKAGNVLLDRDMNPKISDFGLARRFSGYEIEGNTNNVVGTYGYISPEYAVHGLFSVKSDVFSFGVLVLEIVSGKKNRGFVQQEHDDTLLGHAWRLHKDGRSLDLVSPTLRHTCVDSEVLRSIHIGLLCVQHHVEDRPTMSSVVLMLGNDNALPPPKQPAFFTDERQRGSKSVSSTPTLDSVDEVTITLLNAR